MSQDPPAGAALEPGAVCHLVLARVVGGERAGRDAMTWAQLQRLLRAGGAVRPDETVPAGSSITVTGVAYDSRMVEPGHVFVALKGVRADGTAFLQEALDRGAVAVVSEQPPPPGARVPWEVVA